MRRRRKACGPGEMRVNWGRDLKPPPSPSPWPFLRLLLASGAPEPVPLVDVWWDSGCTVFQRRGTKKSTGDVAVCYGSGTQLWRPLKKRTLLSGQCILERPRCCYLTLALWNLYRSSCFPKTFETKRNTSHSVQPAWAPSGHLLVQYSAGSHGTRIMLSLGTLHTPRFRL